jgi:preprotein translocase subunit SecF
MWIVKFRKFFYVLSGAIVLFSVASILAWGLNFGIDFNGGSIIEVKYTGEKPDIKYIEESLLKTNIGTPSIRNTGDNGLIVRTKHLSEGERQAVLSSLSLSGRYQMEEKRFDSVGPTLGDEIKQKSLLSVALVILAIVIFIAFAFRKVSEPVSSWKYGVIAIVALIHDVLVPTGAFAILGHFAGAEVDALFVTALLVILGFSIHDTIVVFDRVRENLKINKENHRKEDFAELVGRSLSQTFARSINTSLTTLLTLLALYVFGSETTKWFSLALLIGITAGTYSSIFLASPLLVTVQKFTKN